jgi:hypothetical protein
MASLMWTVCSSVPPPLTYTDCVRLESRWKGGCVLSVHDCDLVDRWITHHYDHEYLVDLRANEIGGPLASMLAFNAPALTISGSMSPQAIKMADELAQLSSFPVIIRPIAEVPSIYFE